MNYRLIHIAATVSIIIGLGSPAAAQEKAFYRCAASAPTKIASWDSAEILILTSVTDVASFRIDSSTNANGEWMTNLSYAVLQSSGKHKTVYIPIPSNSGDTVITYSTSALEQAESQILIGQNIFILDPYLWRNLMPSTDPDFDYGLITLIKLAEAHSNAIPNSTILSQVWIFNDDEMWNAPLGEQELLYNGTLKAIARNGPEWYPTHWEPDLYVDLVVEIIIDEVSYLIKSTHVLVEYFY